MPLYRHPKRSGPHRIACIALYRALLTQCVAASLPTGSRDALRNVVRHKFRRNRNMQGLARLRATFDAGYEVLDDLDAAAAGSAASVSRIQARLAVIPSRLTSPPPVVSPPATSASATPAPPTATEFPTARASSQSQLQPHLGPLAGTALALRPRPTVTGIRRVPTLASAQKIPILRVTKPQPASLSGMLRQRLARQHRDVEARNRLEDLELPLAETEDAWDGLVGQSLGDGTDEMEGTEGEPSWVEAPQEALEWLDERMQRELTRRREVAEAMVRIVDQERELARKERNERRRERRRVREEEAGERMTEEKEMEEKEMEEKEMEEKEMEEKEMEEKEMEEKEMEENEMGEKYIREAA